MNKTIIRAGVAGASGYSGSELSALIARHPRMDLVFATSESEVGVRVPGTGLRFIPLAEADPGAAEVVFTCLPHGESGRWALWARQAGAVVIDLSADLRDSGSGAVYGLPELWREEVRGAGLIANPGCYRWHRSWAAAWWTGPARSSSMRRRV